MTPSLPSPLSASAVIPANNGNYTIGSIGNNHWLNLAFAETFDGALILAWEPVDPPLTNLIVRGCTVCCIFLKSEAYTPPFLVSILDVPNDRWFHSVHSSDGIDCRPASTPV